MLVLVVVECGASWLNLFVMPSVTTSAPSSRNAAVTLVGVSEPEANGSAASTSSVGCSSGGGYNVYRLEHLSCLQRQIYSLWQRPFGDLLLGTRAH